MSLFAFLASSLIIILLPGTGAIYTVSAGITGGRRAGLLAALGCTAGIVPHLGISIAFSSILLRLDPSVFTGLRLLGAGYLLYLGAGMLLTKKQPTFQNAQAAPNPAAVIRKSVLINLLNPKLTLFFFSFLPQYASAHAQNYIWQCVLLGLVFMLLTLLVFFGYGLLAAAAKRWVFRFPGRIALMQRCFGGVFILFAAELATGAL